MKTIKSIKIIALITMGFCLHLPVVAQSSNQNYIKTTTYLNDAATSSLKTVHYFDGLGRPIQTVQQNTGPANNNQDLISVQEYDAFGRASKAWLPIYRTANTGTYYTGVIATDAKNQYANDTCAFSNPVYEASPLNRILQQYGPGQVWRTANRPVKTEYLTNDSSNPCRYYSVSGDSLVKNASDYAANTLYVIKTTDEDNKIAYEFTDKQGRVLLQRQMDGTVKYDTYYIYDDFGVVRFVLPPVASDSLAAANLTTYNPTSNSALKNYAYIYKYNGRLLCKEKKLPGADPILYVYDKADRLIFSQDGEQRLTNNWTFFKYDAFGRIILTGVWKNSGKTQAGLDSLFKNTLATETFSKTEAYNYTWNSLSGVQGSMVLQANYYDNYKFKSYAPFNNSNYNYATPSGFSNKRYGTDSDTIKSKGLLTGTISLILDNSGTKISTVYYYDERGRMIQSIASNHLAGHDKEYINYSFTGNPTRRQTVHSASGKSDITETYTYEYDHADRLTNTQLQINNPLPTLLSRNVYDDWGRLQKKLRHNTIDTIQYEYNIRNWLTKIKNGSFEENLCYNVDVPSLGTACYNGNIAATTWKYNGVINGYTYFYDKLNRLSYTYSILNNQWVVDGYYSENFSYDKNGNIKQLTRWDNQDIADCLTLTYNGNQVKKITDSGYSQNLSTIKEYRDLANAATEFTYDKNGNMTMDLDRNIVTIRYNLLNLPDTIQFMNGNQIINRYEATGRKLQTDYVTKTVSIVVPIGSTVNSQGSGFTRSGTIYNGNMEYEFLNAGAPSLRRIHNAEGYVDFEPGDPTFYFDDRHNYYRRDHLGNVREVWRAPYLVHYMTSPGNWGQELISTGTVQRTQYYSSGLPWETNTGDNPGTQPYKYEGKEFIEMHGYNGYDSRGRIYIPDFVRTTTMDPLAEKYYSISPYAWCLNNPVRFIDPTGMEIEGTRESMSAFYRALFSTYFTMWSLEQNNSNGKYNDRITSLRSSLGTMNTMANSKNVYSFNDLSGIKNASGDFTYDPKANKFVVSYISMSNLIHEITHAGQYEEREIGFWLLTDENGQITAQSISDIYSEINAYRAQYAYSPFAGIKHAYDINIKFVHSLRTAGEELVYTPGGIANTSQQRLNSNTQFFWFRLGKAPVIGGVQSAIYGQHPLDGIPLNQIQESLFNKK